MTVYEVEILDHADFGKVLVNRLFSTYGRAWSYAGEQLENLKMADESRESKGSYQTSVCARQVF